MQRAWGSCRQRAFSINRATDAINDPADESFADVDASGATGTVRLVGTQKDTIVREVRTVMEYLAIGESFSGRLNPYGDGRASARIVAALTGQAFEEFGAGAASPVRLGQPLAPTSAASQ